MLLKKEGECRVFGQIFLKYLLNEYCNYSFLSQIYSYKQNVIRILNIIKYNGMIIAFVNDSQINYRFV